jgi:23S rRNA maturation-related 3'-5' exoribonuclease YhaM
MTGNFTVLWREAEEKWGFGPHVVQALGPRDAALVWAKWHDEQDEHVCLVHEQGATIEVTDEEGFQWTVRVNGRLEPIYKVESISEIAYKPQEQQTQGNTP